MGPKKKKGSGAKLLCGGMWPGPTAACCHMQAEQSQGLFVCASFSLICGRNGNRQEGPELKFTAEDWVTGARDRQRGEEGKSGKGQRARGSCVGSWQGWCLRSLPAQTINKERKGQQCKAAEQSAMAAMFGGSRYHLYVFLYESPRAGTRQAPGNKNLCLHSGKKRGSGWKPCQFDRLSPIIMTLTGEMVALNYDESIQLYKYLQHLSDKWNLCIIISILVRYAIIHEYIHWRSVGLLEPRARPLNHTAMSFMILTPPRS